MPFNLSGTTITQSNTDTTLSGLNGIAGVTTTTVGSGDNQVIYYFIGAGISITVSGHLMHDPEDEVLVLSPTGRLLISGTSAVYDYGRELVAPNTPQGTGAGQSPTTLPAPTGDRFSTACGLIITNNTADGSRTSTTTIPFRVHGNATMNWRGGEIRLAGTWVCAEGATLSIQSGTIFKTGADAIRFYNAPTTTVNGFTKIGGILYLSGGNPAQFEGYNPIHSVADQTGRNPYAILVDGDGAGGGVAGIQTSPSTITGLSGTGNKVEVAVLDRSYIVLQNPQNGISVATDTWLGGTGNRNEGRVETFKRTNFNVTDLATGNNINGASFRYTDINNGSRTVSNALTPSTTLTNGNDINDVVYDANTDSSGNATINLLTRIWKSPGGTASSDIRVNTDGTADMLLYDYSYNTQTVEVPTAGVGDNAISLALSPDTNVTLTETQAAALASSISITTNENTSIGNIVISADVTLDDLYDYWKWWSTRPANVETTVSPIISGTTFDAGAFFLNINNSATLSKGTKFISLNGTIIVNGVLDTDINGGTVNFGTTGTYGADNNYSGGIVVGLRTAPFILTNTTFGSVFTVGPGASSIQIEPQGTTDFDTNVAGTTVENRFINAGYTVNNAPVLLTTPLAGKVVFIDRTDNTVVSTVTVTAGQEVVANDQDPTNTNFSYNAFYRPTNSAGSDYVMTSILNINPATLPATFQVTEYPAVLTASTAYTNIALNSAGNSVTAGGLATLIAQPTETGSPTVIFNQARAKRFFFDLMNTDEYLESNAILFSNGTLSRETLVPASNGFEVNVQYINLSQSGTNQQLIVIPDVIAIGAGAIGSTLTATATGVGNIQVALFTSLPPTDGISEGQVQNALGIEIEINDIATKANQEDIAADVGDAALGIPPDTTLRNPSSN